MSENVLIIGYGKMGKIHGKHLTELGVKWDYTDTNISHKEVWPKNLGYYTHIIVATPSYSHHQVFERLMAFDGLILIEKPVITKAEHLYILKDNRVMAGLNERFNPVTHYLKDVADEIRQIEFYRDGSGNFIESGIHDIDIACTVLGTDYEIKKADDSSFDIDFNGVPTSFKYRYTRKKERYAFVTFDDETVVTADFMNQEINNAPLKQCFTIKEELQYFLRGYFGEDEWEDESVAYHSHKILVECLEKYGQYKIMVL